MRLVGLLGFPLDHSISPAMQHAAFEVQGLDWGYRAIPASPDELRRAVQTLKDPLWAGANVTAPYKEQVLDMLDELHPAAAALGAVNTILNQGRRLIGYNTDLEGFIRDLGLHGVEPSGARTLVLGAGGGARAVLFALASHTADLSAICRRTLQAAQVAEALEVETGVRLRIFPWTPDSFRAAAARASLIVNATPVGMYPGGDASPWPAEVELPKKAFVYDLVYNPPVTPLVARARAAGLPAHTGLGMLVEQGALAFELWTGQAAPRAEMQRAARAELEGRYA